MPVLYHSDEPPFDYGNWIQKRKLLFLGCFTLGTGILIFIPLGSVYRIGMTVLFAIILVSFLFPLYSYLMFSQKGGKLQEKIYNLIIQNLGENVKGRFIDIGCGNGVLAVKLAQQHEETDVSGIDSWGKDWEYSKSVCEKNALSAKVQNRVHFQKGDAAALEFADDTFDGAVSNLTFHEVKSTADKKSVLQEALRVIKPGGIFVFIDYFYDDKYYGNPAEFEPFLRSRTFTKYQFQALQEMIAIPVLLRHPKILGKVGMIYGQK
jgi:ubiquinone/menaquinone biosynthesis C-methylase UbiE